MFKFLLLISAVVSFYSHNISAENLRISAEELNTQINSNVVILDVRNKNDYEVGHISGAINFASDLTFYNKKTDGKIQQPTLMQEYLQQRGLDIKSNIIIYDDGEMVNAARMFWTLEVYGLSKVKVLDKGYKYWRSKKLPSSQKTPDIKPSKYVARINHKRLASKFTTQLAVYNKNKVVVDARSLSAYKGKESVAKRFGHIASAINVPFNHNIVQNTKYAGLKSIKELKGLYSNIPNDKKVIIYCKIGLVSTTNYFALRELGYDVANYDASWREWGNDDSLPIER